MSSVQIQTFSVEGQQQPLDIEDSGRIQRGEWVLNSPDPPGLWHELIGSIKETVFPHGNKHYSSSSRKRTPWKCAVSFLHALFPILSWGKNYTASNFKNDLMAGLTLASLSIPQSIGYASLAKLDPEYGLYTSIVPPLIYALMGSSKELAIGPVAVVSMLLASLVQKIEDPVADPIAYRKLVFTATFFAGTFQAVFGVFRLGFLVDFFSHAAIVGFMAESVFRSLHTEWYPLNFLLGCSFLIFLLFTRFIGRRNKKLFWLPAIAPLLSVILSTLIVFLTKADKHGVKIVKHIKRGLNPSSVHQIQLNGPHVGQAAKVGLISAIIALTEAIAVGRSFATVRGYHLDGNKEMVAMGFMNIAGSLSSCYVATGSFSRTAVNFSAGCKTVVSNIVMAVTVLVSMELLTRLLYFTPIAILASIILSALPGLIDINEAYYIWKVDKLDFLACLGAFLGVLFASVEIGLMAAVTISFAKLLLRSIRPGIEELGRLPGTDIFFNSALCFANANFIRERIVRWVTEEENERKDNGKGSVEAVILDMSNMMNIDTSGICALEELHRKLVSDGIQLAMANPRLQVIHKLKLGKFVDKIGRGWIFLTIGEAVDACLGSNFATLSSC
ncbi:hypothetical protein SLA2020_368110 [Shorea laevis]